MGVMAGCLGGKAESGTAVRLLCAPTSHPLPLLIFGLLGAPCKFVDNRIPIAFCKPSYTDTQRQSVRVGIYKVEVTIRIDQHVFRNMAYVPCRGNPSPHI